MAFLCVDVGGTNTLVGLGNDEFKLVEKVRSEKFLSDIEGTLKEDIVDKTSHSLNDVDKVAVAVAGPINREEGVFYPPNIDHMEEVQIVEPMENFGEVMIVNDCTSAVAGEYYYGERDAENMVYVTISSGIGAGVILDGNVIEGFKGNVGEIGHMPIDHHGLECGCGGVDHWEAYCSGNRMPQMSRKLYGEEFENSLELFEEYENGGDRADKAIEKMQELNAKGFTNIIDLFNPEVVWLGGAVALNHYETVIEEVLDDVSRQIVNEMPQFDKCSLGNEAVIHGLRAVCNGKFRPQNSTH